MRLGTTLNSTHIHLNPGWGKQTESFQSPDLLLRQAEQQQSWAVKSVLRPREREKATIWLLHEDGIPPVGIAM